VNTRRSHQVASHTMPSLIEWGSAAEDLLRLGWVRLPGALTAEVVADLMAAPRPEWHSLPDEEGVVRQHGFGSYVPFSETDATVRGVGNDITAALSLEVARRVSHL